MNWEFYMKDETGKLNSGTLVPLGAAISVIIVLISLTVWVVTQLQEVKHSVNSLEYKISKDLLQIHYSLERKTLYRWTSNNMLTWAGEFSKSNPTIIVPSVKEIIKDSLVEDR